MTSGSSRVATSPTNLSRPSWTETITHTRTRSRRCPPSAPPESNRLTGDFELHHNSLLDCDPVAVELEEVVAGGDGPPFRPAGRSPAALEAADLAVELQLTEDRLDRGLAPAV